jgi:hypothetical protein
MSLMPTIATYPATLAESDDVDSIGPSAEVGVRLDQSERPNLALSRCEPSIAWARQLS